MKSLRVFATETVISANAEAEAFFEPCTTTYFPFIFRIIQDENLKPPAVLQIKGAYILSQKTTKMERDFLDSDAIISEYAFIPSSKGHIKASFCGEHASISWEPDSQKEFSFLIKDFYGNTAYWCANTWALKENLSQSQIDLADSISSLEQALKAHTKINGFSSEDPETLRMLGLLCELRQHPANCVSTLDFPLNHP